MTARKPASRATETGWRGCDAVSESWPKERERGLGFPVRAADEAFLTCAAGTATTTVSIGVGSEQVKALGVSPDAFAQLAFQLAHQRAKA